MASEPDIVHLRSWIGSERTREETITPRLAASLAAVLDEPVELVEGDAAPTGIQWCLFPEIAPMHGLGPDGHPARGGFLPPVPLPRRMWAGGGLRFRGDFHVGDTVRCRSHVADVSLKQGRSGPLCFVSVIHNFETGRGPVLEERHDIVYRAADTVGASAPPQGTARPHSQEADTPDNSGTPSHQPLRIHATPVLLMRYSAVTFNGHRIHYDRDYARNEESYPGLVVHGPLQATYLLRLARQTLGVLPAKFDFRGTAPLFDGDTFTVNVRKDAAGCALWIEDANRQVTMTARAEHEL